MLDNSAGRHRADGRYNPLNELATVVTRSAEPAAKTTAVLAASGGLLAAMSVPATAAPGTPVADGAASAGGTTTVAAAPAVTAPKGNTTAVAAFGKLGVKAERSGPTPWQRRANAARDARIAAAAAAREEARAERAAAQAADAAEREQQAASRTAERTAPSTTSAPASAPATASAPTQTTAPAPSAGGSVLSIAARYEGIMYVYGGTTPAGFDCSGFTQYVFAQVGISLPRTAAQQQAMATPVSNPQPGDLVFYGYPAYHMGIYAGNGMMWDSPRTGKAVSLRPVFAGVSGYGRV